MRIAARLPDRRRARSLPGPTAVVALVALVGALAAACGGGGDGGDDTTTTTEEETTVTEVPLDRGQQIDAALYVPAIGDCFDRRYPDPERPLREVILVVPCREPHTYEVFDLWTPEIESDPESPTVPYPDVETFTTDARNACVAQLEDFVGRPYELSVLEVEPLLPNPDEWDLGNRAAGCLAFHRDGDLLTGTQRDADL